MGEWVNMGVTESETESDNKTVTMTESVKEWWSDHETLRPWDT